MGSAKYYIAPFITDDTFEYHLDEVYADTTNIYLRTEMRILLIVVQHL